MVGCLIVPVTKTHFPPPKSESGFLRNPHLQKTNLFRKERNTWSFYYSRRNNRRLKRASSSSSSRCSRGAVCGLFPVDPWAPTIDSESIASQLFAASLFPYLGFLYFITKSNSAPKLTLFGFYFLLAFVGATIPAGIYAKLHYGTSLSNVDWLHGSAESLLTLTNLFIVLGLREALRKVKSMKDSTSNPNSETKEEKQPSI